MIYILLLLFISIFPVYLIGLYVYKKDDQKEPKKLLKKLFCFGMLSCIPAAIIEILLDPLFGPEESRGLFLLLVYVASSIAFIEELFKWLVVYKCTYNHNEFDQIYDAIVYAVFVSLGFACFENVFYVLSSGLTTGLFRAVTSIPGHASDAIIMGNYLGLAKLAKINNNNKLATKNLMLSILMPTLAHTIYDYCLFSKNYILIGLFVIFLIFIYVYSIKKIKRVSAAKQSLMADGEIVVVNSNVRYCPNCGTVCYGSYCPKCGTTLNNQ